MTELFEARAGRLMINLDGTIIDPKIGEPFATEIVEAYRKQLRAASGPYTHLEAGEFGEGATVRRSPATELERAAHGFQFHARRAEWLRDRLVVIDKVLDDLPDEVACHLWVDDETTLGAFVSASLAEYKP